MVKRRISVDEWALGIAEKVAQRCTCYRRKIGAIITQGTTIVAQGYIGAPSGCRDCFEQGFCLRDRLKIPHGQRYELCRSVHAEQNAIINAAKTGAVISGGDIYIYGADNKSGRIIDVYPCDMCKKMIINANIQRVVCRRKKGKISVDFVEQWVLDWAVGDMLSRKYRYGKEK